MASRFKLRLTRAGVVDPARWATQYRMMSGDYKGLWSFDHHPWLKEMHLSKAETNVGQKAAQMGYSETLINLAFYTLDVLERNVLYVLPNFRPDASDFTNRAFNPAIESSPHLKNMFRGVSNVGHKMAGLANLYIRGSNTRAGLKSVPASLLLFDEFEEHDRSNTKLAEERMSGQSVRTDWKVSTPMAPGTGINAVFEKSTKEEFHFRCPSCSRMILLKFPESLVITSDDPESIDIHKSHLICHECKAVIPHEAKSEIFKNNEWVPANTTQLTRGFHISQLYSCALPPWKIAKLYLESMKDITAEQEFFNSKLGLAHLVAGAKLTLDKFESLIKGYSMVDSAKPGNIVTLGCDVGRKLHIEIDHWDVSKANALDWNARSVPKLIWAGELDDFEQLDQLMIRYNVNFAVVDAMPETRAATSFAARFYGRVRICRYNSNATSRSVFAGEDDIQVSVNRTAWLDQSLGRFRNGSIFLPSNLPRDYVQQLMVPMRIPVKDSQGNTVYRYITQDGVHDHYAHARNYAEIALPFALSNKVYKDVD